MFDPGECDRSLSAALAEPEQKRPWTPVAQQSLLPLFADEAHDGAADGQGATHSHNSLLHMFSKVDLRVWMNISPVVPQGQQVSFNEIQDSFNPQPEGKRFLVSTLLLDRTEAVRFSTDTS